MAPRTCPVCALSYVDGPDTRYHKRFHRDYLLLVQEHPITPPETWEGMKSAGHRLIRPAPRLWSKLLG